MSNIYAEYKSGRVLYLYTKLMHGEHIHKSDEAKRFEVSPRSIQRDIDDLRTFFENQAAEGLTNQELVYDKSEDCYLLRAREDLTLSNSEILAVCKILLESRALRRDEMEPIIQKLVNACIPQKNRAIVQSLLANEMFHYVEPHHQKQFVSNLWDIGTAVQEHRVMQITYEKQDGTVVDRTIQPVGIMFSEYYFYLTAFIENIDKQMEFTNPDDLFPTIYRIDRIREYQVLDRTFVVPYKDRFEEGEFRKRIQFMYGGRLRHIRFLYTGKNVEAVLDRLPTAKILQHDDEGYLLTAEVFGDGIDMWIRSQGEQIQIL